MRTAATPAATAEDLTEWLLAHLAGAKHLELADALAQVLRLHVTRALQGQVMNQGRCYWCDDRGRGGRLLRTWQEPGARGNTYTMHEHLDPYPACPRCDDGDHAGDYTGPWPCATVAAIATSLGIDYPPPQQNQE